MLRDGSVVSIGVGNLAHLCIKQNFFINSRGDSSLKPEHGDDGADKAPWSPHFNH